MVGPPSRFRPRLSIMLRRILVSNDGSSSAARAGAAVTTAATSARPRTAGAVNVLAKRVGRMWAFRVLVLQPPRIPAESDDLTPMVAADQGAFTARSPRNESYRSPMTPATMATSARLKTYQL